MKGAQPEFRFRNGKLFKLEYLEFEVFERYIPFGTRFAVKGFEYSYEAGPLTAAEQVRMGEISLSCKGYGFAAKLAHRRNKSLIWC